MVQSSAGSPLTVKHDSQQPRAIQLSLLYDATLVALTFPSKYKIFECTNTNIQAQTYKYISQGKSCSHFYYETSPSLVTLTDIGFLCKVAFSLTISLMFKCFHPMQNR